MKIVKSISLGIGMQVLMMIMHLLIHSTNGSFDDHIQIIGSFIVVMLLTYLAVLCFALPIYAIFCGQIITLLFILIFENEGVYLLYYLHKGSSQWFNPDIFTDAVIIVSEMLVIQLLSLALAKNNQELNWTQLIMISHMRLMTFRVISRIFSTSCFFYKYSV